jgi:hypothetical protein
MYDLLLNFVSIGLKAPTDLGYPWSPVFGYRPLSPRRVEYLVFTSPPSLFKWFSANHTFQVYAQKNQIVGVGKNIADNG